MIVIKKRTTPTVVFRKIKNYKELTLSRKDIQAVMNALDNYRDYKLPRKDTFAFKQEYREYLEDLRLKFLMLEDW